MFRDDSVVAIVSALLDEADDSGDHSGAAKDGAADTANPDEDNNHDCLAAVVLGLADTVVAAARAAVGASSAATDGASIGDAGGIADAAINANSDLAAA